MRPPLTASNTLLMWPGHYSDLTMVGTPSGTWLPVPAEVKALRCEPWPSAQAVQCHSCIHYICLRKGQLIDSLGYNPWSLAISDSFLL